MSGVPSFLDRAKLVAGVSYDGTQNVRKFRHERCIPVRTARRPVHLRQTYQQKRQIVVFAGVTPSPASNRIDAPAASTRSGRWSASPKSDEKGSDLLASGGRRDVTDVRRQIAADHRRVTQLRKKSATPLVFSASLRVPPRTKRSSSCPEAWHTRSLRPAGHSSVTPNTPPKTTNCRFSQPFTCA